MADNISITAGTGTSISTDEVTTLNGGTVAAVQVQRIKPVYGPDGSATDVSTTNGLPIQGITAASSSVAWTSATTVNTTNSIAVGGMNAVSVTLVPTTTFTGGAITFEVSPDGSNWVPLNMARVDTYNTESTYTIVASTNRGWSASVDGFTNFRVRLSTVITGTGTATVIVIPQAFAVEPIVTVGQATAANLQMTVGTALPAGTAAIGKVLNSDTFGTTTAMTITLASLASSTAGVGRQSTLVTANTARSAHIGVKIGLAGAGETVNSLVYVYLIRGDGTINDDAAGTTDAAITIVNAPLLGTLVVPAATTASVSGLFDTKPYGSLGKTFGIAIVNASGAALSATAGNSAVEYTLIT